MKEEHPFIDFYARLNVAYDCSVRQLEGAYHHCAKLYHPDTGESGDVDRFTETVEAYKVLRDPESRARYDERYFQAMGIDPTSSATHRSGEIREPNAVEDGAAHSAILLALYKQRRESPSDPGIPAYLLEEALACTQEQFDFHAWYLKAKGLIQITEHGTLAITVDGVDYVITASRSSPKRPLYITDFRQ